MNSEAIRTQSSGFVYLSNLTVVNFWLGTTPPTAGNSNANLNMFKLVKNFLIVLDPNGLLYHTKQINVGIINSGIYRHKSGSLSNPHASFKFFDNGLSFIFQVVKCLSIASTTVRSNLTMKPCSLSFFSSLVRPPLKLLEI